MSNEDKDGDLEHMSQDNGDGSDDSLSLDAGRPAVATAPAKFMLFIVVGLVIVGIVVKSVFFPSEKVVVTNKVKKPPETVAAGTNKPAGGGISPMDLPTAPQQDPITPNYSSLDTNRPQATGGGKSGPDLGRLPPPPVTNSGGSVSLPAISMPAPPSLPAGGPTLATPAGIKAPTIAAPPAITAPVPAPVAGAAGTAAAGGKAPPPPPPGLAAPTMPELKTALPKDEATQKRVQADSTLLNSPPAASTSGAGNRSNSPESKAARAGTGFGGTDPNSQFAQGVTGGVAQVTVADRIMNLEYTIIQGKIIYGVLETAVNSDLPGTLRAVVSHDVYAEAGRAILIPKGSRLIGTYNSAVKRGQARVFIIWTRIIRPDGVTMAVDSPAVDNLGRAGLEGDVDNKYIDMFSTALLTSSLDIGLAAIGQGLFGDQQQTTTNNSQGGSTTTSSATGTAMQQAVTNIGDIGKQVVGSALGLAPTISVDQGTPVNIYVNKELEFPPSVTASLDFVR